MPPLAPRLLVAWAALFLAACQNPATPPMGGGPGSPDTPETPPATYRLELTVTVPDETPLDAFVSVYLLDLEGSPHPPTHPLTRLEDGRWHARIDLDPAWVGDSVHYHYCRNNECAAADERLVPDEDHGWRQATFTDGLAQREDTVSGWRWFDGDALDAPLDDSQYLATPPAGLPRSDFLTGAVLPDWWKHDWIPALPLTMARLRDRLHARWVEYVPVPEITAFYPTPQIDREGVNGTPDEDLVQLIQDAHDAGLSVFLNPVPWAASVVDDSPGQHSAEWWQAWADAWGAHLLHYATIAQEQGVEMLGFRMWPEIYAIATPEEADRMNTLAVEVLNQVRAVYGGKILVQFTPWGPDLDVYGLGDYLGFTLWDVWPFVLANGPDYRVDDLAATLGEQLDGQLQDPVARWGKPLVIEQLAAASLDGAAQGANPPEDETNPEFPDHPQWQRDLQEQADLYEAFLRALATREWIAGAFVFAYPYWLAQDKTIAVAGKPAERVIGRWFQWITP